MLIIKIFFCLFNPNFQVAIGKYKILRLTLKLGLTGFGEKIKCIFEPNIVHKEYCENSKVKNLQLIIFSFNHIYS